MKTNEKFKVSSNETSTQTNQNSLSSKKFNILDKNNGEIFEANVSFQWANEKWATWGREYLIEWCGGYTHPESQSLTARKTTFEGKRNQIAKLVTWATSHKPDSSMGCWDDQDILKLLKDITFNKIDLPDRNIDESALNVLSKDTILKTIWHIENSGSLYRIGKLSDGYLGKASFEYFLPELEDEIRASGLNYPDWLKGGTHDSVPLEIATLMLMEAINTIQSNQTKALQAYFNTQRGTSKLNPSNTIFNKRNTLLKQILSNQTTINHHKKNVESVSLFIDELNNNFNKLGGDTSFNPVEYILNFKAHKELNVAVKEVFDACKVIFFCLTGIRVHEMTQTNSQDYYLDIDNVWRFKATEDKTQGGTKQLRALAGKAAEAATIMCDLSYINKRQRNDGQNTYLFGIYTAMKPLFNSDDNENEVYHGGACISRENFADRLNIFFNKVFNKYGEQLLEDCSGVSPHGFRHSFVDFVLRRFDGNIHAAIRNHFRHCINGEFTSTYTDSKAQDQIERAAEEKYMQELVRKMVGEYSQNFTGPIALFIQREVDKFKFVNEKDLDGYIDELTEDLEHIVPHEYGYCLVFKGRENLAKCLDKKTGIPKILNGCFELCSGCPNSFHHEPSNKEAIIRNVISHESFLDKFPIKNTAQAKISETVVSNGHKILSAMGA
ncbi:MAG: integrase [Psychrosphaera sp.]|jgi:integrase